MNQIATSLKSIEVINPATEEVVGTYPLMEKSEVFEILEAMKKAQISWRKLSVLERTEYFVRLAALMRTQVEHFAKLITVEMGKPIAQARAEILKCADLCDFYASEAPNMLADQMIETEYQKSYRSFQSLGIIFGIMPWNYPAWQVLRFVVPNLIAGNAAVLKHAPNSTGMALALEGLFIEAGFPSNLFRSLVIDVDLASEVIQHSAVKGVTLTGSERAGMAVASEAGKALKKVVLELGGSDPYVVLEDADLDLAVQESITSRLSNSGQVCIAAKRLIVVAAIYEAFVAKLRVAMEDYQCADPMLDTTMMGPMAREDLRLGLHQQVLKSIETGATCLMGGNLQDGQGYFYPATLLLNVTPSNPAFQEELFGPVVTVICAADEAEALKFANDSVYGLGAAVFTQDVKHGEDIARNILNAGSCFVNAKVASNPKLPFGGIHKSGFGRELSAEGLHEFTNVKTVVVR